MFTYLGRIFFSYFEKKLKAIFHANCIYQHSSPLSVTELASVWIFSYGNETAFYLDRIFLDDLAQIAF